jgi:hypothetical protein
MQIINFNLPQQWHEWQFLDNLSAYQQSLNLDYNAKYKIQVSYSFDCLADINVCVLYMPEQYSEDDTNKYDLIIITNDHEPLKVGTPFMKQFLSSKENIFMVANSCLNSTHQLYDRVIPDVGNMTRCNMYWTNGFYPQSYENLANEKLPRTKDLIYINGRNDSWRHHLVNLLEQSGSQIPVKSTLTKEILKTLDSQFEFREDTEFRQQVNNLYSALDKIDAEKEKYYSRSITVGIDKKFGLVAPGNFILPEYFEYRCVIFPESTWQNDELCLTEKICKCLYSESLPWPIGGSNINKLYNEIGFYTAWNVLPDHLKAFDGIKNHSERYQALAHAIIWLEKNPEILSSQEVKSMLKQNKENFLLGRHTLQRVQKFAKIIDHLIVKKNLV